MLEMYNNSLIILLVMEYVLFPLFSINKSDKQLLYINTRLHF